MGQRPQPQRPAIAQLLAHRSQEVCTLEALSLGLSSLEARGTLVGPIDAIAAALYRPNRHPIGCKEWTSCLCGHHLEARLFEYQTMSTPQLHHYVPQFYLRRFLDPSERLWVWDRDEDRAFATKPGSVAAERSFYYLDSLVEKGHDPLTMESQFASLEHEIANITNQWIEWIRDGNLGMSITIPEPNRDLVSLFLALQFLRTADSREILAQLAPGANDPPLSERERRRLHTELLWDENVINPFREHIHAGIWIFGHNTTGVPFVTSDNPVAFRTSDNAMWLKAGMLGGGTYVVYPLTPDIVMYCYPREAPWLKLASFDSSVSPVSFTADMVESENSAQVFMASRFIISCKDDFSAARTFAPTIGTDIYAPPGRRRIDDPGL